MNDLISREAAIDVIDKIFPVDPMRNDYTQGITCGAALATEYIKQFPSAQPEIIRCGECKHSFLHDNGEKISRICGLTRMCGTTPDDWYCADAERREE